MQITEQISKLLETILKQIISPSGQVVIISLAIFVSLNFVKYSTSEQKKAVKVEVRPFYTNYYQKKLDQEDNKLEEANTRDIMQSNNNA